MEKSISKTELASCIDSTLLKPFAVRDDIRKLCAQAMRFGFYSVCVNPIHVRYAISELADSRVKVCTVVGFPLGANKKEVKAFEAKSAIRDGAKEIDMVIGIEYVKSGEMKKAEEDIIAVVKASAPYPVKVIIETCFLSDAEKESACRLIMNSGASFVKTSTGFGTEGAKVEDVKLIKSIVGERLMIKAAGGIQTLRQALLLIEAGADRLGTSKGVEIIAELG
jgi:deoxyribose-phosphate aldolase